MYDDYLISLLEDFYNENENYKKLLWLKEQRRLRFVQNQIILLKKTNYVFSSELWNLSRIYPCKYFEIYARGKRVYYDKKDRKIKYIKNKNCIETTIGQLNFIREGVIKTKIFDYITDNVLLISSIGNF